MSCESTDPVLVHRRDLAPGWTPVAMCRALRRSGSALVWFDGSGGFERPWTVGPLVAVHPAATLCAATAGLPAVVERRVLQRRRGGGTGETGVAVALPYEPGAACMVFEVDRSVRFDPGGARLTIRSDTGARDEALPAALESGPQPRDVAGDRRPARVRGPAATSLPREAYLRAVARIRRHILRGDVYQANLCQRFDAPVDGDPFELHASLVAERPAPMSAWVEGGGVALASISPEVFLRLGPPDRVATFPIKGTRPRGATPEADARARAELLGSAKDRAELTMIVDLERNDLGRVCRAGSIRVVRLAALESFATVHHLVAEVEGRLRPGVGPGELIGATFPGGSISGAPKSSALRLLESIEPVPRGYFTGSLFWFGDDGAVDSSILIRTVEFREGRARIGAGGGIVADSDPEAEWLESNHKARALARQLGFDPVEAR